MIVGHSCPEANFDILYIVNSAQKKYDDLHKTEIGILAYLAVLLSIYDGHHTEDWGYLFSKHALGGPDSYGLEKELDLLLDRGLIEETGRSFYRLTTQESILRKVNMLSTFERFSWRVKYLETAVSACFSKSLPIISRAMKAEPGFSSAIQLQRTTTLHFENTNELFTYFKEFKSLLGDMRDDILVPASIWIDYLIAVAKKEEGSDD